MSIGSVGMGKKGWVRVAGAAAHSGLSKSKLNKLRCTGGGPPYSKIGGAILYSIDNLDAWLAEQQRRSTSDEGQVAA